MPRRDDPQFGLGKAIRTLRNEAKMTQEELGLAAEIHSTWISHIESGRINPTFGNVRRLANGLNVTVAELASMAEQYEREIAKSASEGG
jgi:transcriptional regulator with XRE-family HTH domain